MSHSPSPYPSATSDSATSSSSSPSSTSSSLATTTTTTRSSSASSSRGKSSSVKPPNVFSSDGSFLDRVRRSMKEDEEKRKQLEALERKKQFADRFKKRGKRSPPPSEDDVNEASPKKPKQEQEKVADGKPNVQGVVDTSPQAEYHKSMESYSQSLKDSGTGVRSLAK